MDNSKRIYPSEQRNDHNKGDSFFGNVTKAIGHFVGVITGKKLEVDIIWDTPKPIYVGTQLTDLQLNARVQSRNQKSNKYLQSLDSKFLYNPSIGSILDEGVHELEVIFDVGDNSKKFNKLTKKVVSITILPRLIPTIRWSDKTMRHNDVITNNILDAKCIDTNGNFTYNIVIGTKLIINSEGYTLTTAKFEPIDNVKYTSVFKTIKITMLKALPTIIWNPSPLYQGQPITKDQLNAVVVEDELVDGCLFVYNPTIGHIFDNDNDDNNLDNDIDSDDTNDDDEIMYNLVISNIFADNLLNCGTRFDAQDPGVVIRIGDHYTFTTNRVQDGGTSTVFPEVFKDICLSLADIKKWSIEVEAHNMDKNNASKKLIGTGMMKLTDAIPRNDEKCTFTIPLKSQGEVTMVGKLTLVDNVAANETVSLLLQNFNAKKLQNVGGRMDAQDPGIIVKIGSSSFYTDRACDAGTDATFKDIFKDIMLKVKDIEAGLLLELEVHNMDKNLKSKKLIGRGNIFLTDAISQFNEMTTISIPLTPTGTVTMQGKLTTIIKDEDEDDEREGPVMIRIDQLAISGVEDCGSMFDRQDPGLTIHVGHMSLKTERIQEGGTDTTFPEVFDQIEVQYEDHLEVEVHNIDGNGLSKKCIGRGFVILSDVIKCQHKLIDIKIPLINSTGKQQGTVFMRVLLEKIISDIVAEPISLKSRIKLNLDQLSIKNVEDAGTLFDKQDPGLLIRVGKVHLKTDRVQEGGTSAIFNETFDGIIAKYSDIIDVEVHNMDSNGKSKKRIGRGKVQISQLLQVPGISKCISIHLTNSKHKAQGIVRMRAKFEVLPDSNSCGVTVRFEPPPKMQKLYDVLELTAFVTILPKMDYVLTWDMKPYTYTSSKLNGDLYFNAIADIAGYSTYYYYDPNNGEGNEWVLLTEETILPTGLHHVCLTFTPELPIYMVDHVYRMLSVRPKSIPWIAWDSPIYMDYGALTDKQLSANSIVPGSFEFSQSIGDIMNVTLTGHVIRTRFTPDDCEQYTIEEKEVVIIVPNIPSIIWTISNCNSTPHSNINILYDGQPLSEDELCISVLDQDLVGSGTVIYDPKLGDTLPIGKQTLQATYIIDDKFNNVYQKRTIVTIPVTILKKIDPVISWETPDPIRYGKKLKKTELNATCDIAGEFSYYPPIGKLLPMSFDGTTLKCVFHPHNKIKYNSVAKEVTLVVLKAHAKLYWQFPKFLYETQPLTEKQLNAKILSEELLDGLLEYNPPLGTILSAGIHDLFVKFIPPPGTEDSYDITDVKVTITIKPQKCPVILWSTPSAIFVDMRLSSEQLNATCPKNRGHFTYNPPIDSLITSPGIVTLTVIFQPENSIEYCTVEKTVELEVREKIRPNLKWTSPNPIFYGHTLSESILNAVCDHDNGTIIYDPIIDTKLMVTNEDTGPHLLKATFVPNDKTRYLEVETTVALNVKKSTPRVKWPHQGKVFENTPLPASIFCAKIIDEELQVQGGKFIYNPNAGEVLGLGEHLLMVVYEPPADLLDRFTVASAFTKIRVIPHKVPVENSNLKMQPGWEMGKDKRHTLNRPPEPQDFAWTQWGTK